MMKWFKRLDNPFVLAAEGFLAGAILFWATTPNQVQAQPNPPSGQLISSAMAGHPL